MLWPTLRALQILGGSATVQEIEDRVIELQKYSADQVEEVTVEQAWFAAI